MKYKHRGFTLIELMVVISIIGMLSSVVLVSLNSARIKANNTKVIQTVQQLRNQIELGLRSDGKYGNLFGSSQSGGGGYRLARQAEISSDTKLRPLIDSIMEVNGTTFPAGYGGSYVAGGACGESYLLNTPNDITNKLRIFVDIQACVEASGTLPASSYAIYALMMPGNSGYFCLDSAGRTTRPSVGFIPNAPAVATTCQ